MNIYLFIIFIILVLFFIIRDPFWGVICFLASMFLRFQDYVPQLLAVSIPMYILIFTFIIAIPKGSFHDLRIDNKIILLFISLTIIIGIPLIQGQFNEKHYEFIGQGLFSFLIILLLTNEFKLKVLFHTFTFLILFVALTLFHSYYVGDNYYFFWRHERPFGRGFLENPNALAMWLNFGFIISTFLMSFSKNFCEKALYIIGSSISMFGVMLCNSRSGVLEFFVAFSLTILSIGKRKRILLLVMISLITVFVALRAGSGFWSRMDTITGKDDSGKYEGSAQERLNSWRSGIKIFKEYPFVGVGLNNIVKHNFRVNYNGELEGRSIHNGYIELIAENGILGAFFWVLLIIQSIRDLFSFRLLENSTEISMHLTLVSKTMLCCLGVFAICNIFGSLQYSTFLFLLFGISSGIKNVIYSQLEKR